MCSVYFTTPLRWGAAIQRSTVTAHDVMCCELDPRTNLTRPVECSRWHRGSSRESAHHIPSEKYTEPDDSYLELQRLLQVQLTT